MVLLESDYKAVHMWRHGCRYMWQHISILMWLQDISYILLHTCANVVYVKRIGMVCEGYVMTS